MPRVRDWTWQYQATATATTLACNLPKYVQGDLLVAICSADSGSQTWSCSGWTQYTSQTNTANIGILWKIAGASEADPTITYSVAETVNIRMVSIEDTDTTTPFANVGNLSASTVKATMPTTTATRDNSLLLFCAANSGVVVQQILEGACVFEGGADGTAHSDAFSWGFQATAGTTPSGVIASYASSAASAAKYLTLVVNPPSSGATLVPAYCAADASVYINPIQGTTGYNGDTAFAATATTYFGTTIQGRTLGNGTVAAAADVGINSFHSMGQLTGVVTNGNYAGATVVMATANKPAVTNKNILVHIKPSTPKVLQTTDPISKSTSKGVAIGMCSTANSAFKVWHVHGDGTTWNTAQHVPVVINEQNTSGLLQSTGAFDPASVLAFGFFASGFVVAPIWQFGSIWAMGRTTIAGGNATSPVDINGIWKVCAAGKERMSVLKQGASQALLLQSVQFGNGGTNPIYLDLDATAIEFPQQYNVASKNVFYCSIDNVVGLLYYAGAGDTIKHTNAVVSSKSKFTWEIHASSSASATYDFRGLSIIGAGIVTLQPVTTFDSMSFTSCPSITQYSALIANSNFTGSYLYSNALGNISGCSFTSSGTGHAIEITTAGTYTFSANTFSGYGADGTTNAAIYNNSGGAVTINISGGGDTPTVRNGAGASTTVNNTITLTLNGLIAGSDIVILNAGTEVERVNVDANPTTTYNYVYDTTGNVDIKVYKRGYVPFSILNYALQSTNSSLPVAQVADRNYIE